MKRSGSAVSASKAKRCSTRNSANEASKSRLGSVRGHARAPSALAIYKLVSPHAKHDGRTFTMADAESLRDVMSEVAVVGGSSVSAVLERANRALSAHGVESILRDDREWVDRYFGDTRLLYVNMGDAYIDTIAYDVAKKKFIIRSWNELVD